MKNKVIDIFRDKKALIIIGSFLFISPLFVYAYQFGIGLWTDHSDWANMGTAIGGIYSPILAATTILLLYKQYQLQRKVSRSQNLIMIASDSRADVIYLLEEIKKTLLSDKDAAQVFLNILKKYEETPSEDIRNLIYNNHRTETVLLTDLFSLLHRLRNEKHIIMDNVFNSSKMKMVGQLSIEICHAYEFFYSKEKDKYEPIIRIGSSDK